MSYPSQKAVLNRLEQETRKSGRKHEDDSVRALLGEWDACKDAIRGVIMNEYRRDFGSGTWDLARAKGAIARMTYFVSAHLENFHRSATHLIASSIRQSYRHEALRQAWMLDQLTPPSYKPRTPLKTALEAARPGDFTAKWGEALEEWIRAYQANLATNLRLEALHEGSLMDAADEVDAARVDNFDPAYKFSSLLSNQILVTQQDARDDVADENDDMVAEEIFQTMEDSRVCDDCDSQDGKLVDDVELLPHVWGFNCRCYTRIVPREFAEPLRDGTDEEREAALEMDARGMIPDAMAIKDPDTGKLKAHLTVQFDSWAGRQGLNIVGQAR